MVDFLASGRRDSPWRIHIQTATPGWWRENLAMVFYQQAPQGKVSALPALEADLLHCAHLATINTMLPPISSLYEFWLLYFPQLFCPWSLMYSVITIIVARVICWAIGTCILLLHDYMSWALSLVVHFKAEIETRSPLVVHADKVEGAILSRKPENCVHQPFMVLFLNTHSNVVSSSSPSIASGGVPSLLLLLDQSTLVLWSKVLPADGHD